MKIFLLQPQLEQQAVGSAYEITGVHSEHPELLGDVGYVTKQYSPITLHESCVFLLHTVFFLRVVTSHDGCSRTRPRKLQRRERRQDGDDLVAD